MQEDMQEKMEYCLNCKTKPCTGGCPLGNEIRKYDKLWKKRRIQKSI